MALAAASLALGVLVGLARLGWPWAGPVAGWSSLHGPIMACGFVATVVAVERAVALGRAWALAVPIAFAAAALLALSGVPPAITGGVATAAACANVVVLARLVRRVARPPAHLLALVFGAAALVPAHLAWLLGHPPHASVPWWIAFLVTTVAAERWERARLTGLPRGAGPVLSISLALLGLGACVPHFAIHFGLRPLAPGLLAVAAWLFLNDAALRSSGQRGERRHVRWCLIGGHAWLAVTGLLAATVGEAVVGPHWDAVLHALFVGVLFSMIFAHAPIVLGPLLGLRLAWTAWFHLPHALLHVGLVLRVSGDLLGGFEARRWGGLLNAVAIASFALLALARARRAAA